MLSALYARHGCVLFSNPDNGMSLSQLSFDRRTRSRCYVLLSITGLLLVALIVFAVWWGPTLWPILSDRERFRAWIESYESYATLVFVLVQCMQVVLFFIPGEVTQFAGGYIFGTWKGLLLSYLGITLGSVMAFYLARLFGYAAVDLLISREALRKFDRLVYGKSGFWPMLVLFLLPGIPKDLLCYIAGLTPMHVVTFLLISIIGRFPGVILSCLLGAGLAQRNWKTFGLSAAITVGLIGIVYLFRGPIEQFRKAYLVTKKETELLGTPHCISKRKTRSLQAADAPTSGKSSA
jgi:uncharacterized membrane protein YdjX (TVP38/TMEM64 family)